MNHKVNLQARIKRHSRILKDNLWNSLHHSSKKNVGIKLVAFLTVLMFPVYPAFSSYVYSNNQLEFDRGEIDESTILLSYDEMTTISDWKTGFEAKDSYLSVWASVDEDYSSSNKIIEYDVKEWDTIELIAKKYNVSVDTIFWENNFGEWHLVAAGDKIKFPPVTGITYTVRPGETVSTIAQRYEIKSEDISKQNLLSNNNIHPWESIILPWAEPIEEPIIEEREVIAKAVIKKKPITKKTRVVKSKAKKKVKKRVTYKKKKARVAKSTYTKYKWRYKLKWRKPYSGAWGNCTYYVASYKNVNWRWNANQWLYRARAKGHATGRNATVWAIIVFQWRGYNPYYGHVAIVMEVHKNHLIVSDMNYRRKNQVTYRKINRWDRSIRGYIYVWD